MPGATTLHHESGLFPGAAVPGSTVSFRHGQGTVAPSATRAGKSMIRAPAACRQP